MPIDGQGDLQGEDAGLDDPASRPVVETGELGSLESDPRGAQPPEAVVRKIRLEALEHVDIHPQAALALAALKACFLRRGLDFDGTLSTEARAAFASHVKGAVEARLQGGSIRDYFAAHLPGRSDATAPLTFHPVITDGQGAYYNSKRFTDIRASDGTAVQGLELRISFAHFLPGDRPPTHFHMRPILDDCNGLQAIVEISEGVYAQIGLLISDAVGDEFPGEVTVVLFQKYDYENPATGESAILTIDENDPSAALRIEPGTTEEERNIRSLDRYTNGQTGESLIVYFSFANPPAARAYDESRYLISHGKVEQIGPEMATEALKDIVGMLSFDTLKDVQTIVDLARTIANRLSPGHQSAFVLKHQVSPDLAGRIGFRLPDGYRDAYV
ncbi:MAG: hypothetical protein Q8P95_04715, partial [bacterium]|nr:hypothetical protein [bacterium]